MPRNQHFHITDIPKELAVDNKHTTGAFSFFNPTHVYLQKSPQTETGSGLTATASSSSSSSANSSSTPSTKINKPQYLWRSRDNRKGRHAVIVPATTATPSSSSSSSPSGVTQPQKTTSIKNIVKNIGRMLFKWSYWDVSWLVAFLFTIGSIVWCLNGFFTYLPLVSPTSEFHNELYEGGPWTAWLGATIFEVGSVFLMIEALNENHSACFGWELKEAFEGGGGEDGGEGEGQGNEKSGVLVAVKDVEGCVHSHRKGRMMRRKGPHTPPPSTPSDSPKQYPSWVWWPSWYALRTHYFHQIGFWACSFQFLGATIFWISGFTVLPHVINMNNVVMANCAFWLPQVIGGTGFIISSTLFMLETQKKWYKPEFGVLGWHIGFWNLVGAIGFTLCGALGFAAANSGALYESTLSTFWGSFAFLIGSVLQWYESVEKYPVEVSKS